MAETAVKKKESVFKRLKIDSFFAVFAAIVPPVGDPVYSYARAISLNTLPRVS